MQISNALVNDQVLITRLKKGERTAFKELVESLQDQVFNTAIGFVHNEKDAEDVAQEVFIEVYNSINDFQEDSALTTWVYRIAINKSLNLLRYKKRKKRSWFFQALFNSDDDVDQLQQDRPFYHPGVDLENKERSAMLFDAIGNLSEAQRVAFTLNKVEGLKYDEIAAIMERSASSVQGLIHRAKEQLKKELYEAYTSGSI
ncbi:MAG: RNA polymerase sigma factor [Balneola sp.]|nr:MAG: RNA polymerase sigma factor [Balneola sp.]